nr:glycoside hydrolase family 127 protein [Kiritimatiellia bacterium]
MNFRTIPVFVLAAGAAAFALAASRDSIDNIGETRLKGPLGEKLDRMVAGHVIGTDVDYITAPFLEKTETKGWWQTEFWGKWMHSAVPYSVYTGSAALGALIDHGIDRMLASQEKDGYIGNYPDELRCGEGWDVWGMKYTMMGLLHYYDGERGTGNGERRTGNGERGKRALEACKRLCDYVIAEIGPNGRRGRELWQTGNWSGYASSSILEPVVWLYRRTNDKKYLDFATYIVKGMTEPAKGPRLLDLALKGVSVADRNESDYTQDADWAYVCKYGRSKAYEMMSCYQGILDYVAAQSELSKDEGGKLADL